MLFLLIFKQFLLLSYLFETFESSEFGNDTIKCGNYCLRNAQMDGLIVTITDCSNYGNVIQRYALKHVLEQNAKRFDTTQIHLTPENKVNMICENTRPFIKKYVGGDDFDPSKLQGYRNYIVGSDQVWRDWFNGNWAKLSPFFLEFVDYGLHFNLRTNCISYAASFGVGKIAMNVTTQARIRPLLEKFSAISVREESGRFIVKNTWGLESTVVLDPTLLLRASDYSRLVENSFSKDVKIEKLFCYVLDENKSKVYFAGNISRALRFGKTWFVPSRRKRFGSVEKWLKGFRDAKFIITDSYHGMIFSIINNTDFVVIGNVNRGLARFESLLETLSLAGRLIDERKLTNVKLSDLGSIDWRGVNKKLDTLRTNSQKWLLENLK